MLFRCCIFQLIIGLGMIGHHTLAKLFYRIVRTVTLGQLPELDFRHSTLRSFFHEGAVHRGRFAGHLSVFLVSQDCPATKKCAKRGNSGHINRLDNRTVHLSQLYAFHDFPAPIEKLL